MASKIRIYRSTGATAPASLEYGELAATIEQGTSGTSANKAGSLFIGNASGNPVEIGGEYTYKLLDHEPGIVNNLSAVIVGNDGQINAWNVAGILTANNANIQNLIAENFNVTGIATFAGGLDLNGNVTVGDDHTDIFTVNSRTGFTTDVTINDNLLVSGITTISSGLIIDSGGIDVQAGGDSRFSDNVLVGLGLTVQGGIEVSGNGGLQVLGSGINVTGVSTFNDSVNFSSGVDFVDINVSSAATVGILTVTGSANFDTVVYVGSQTVIADDVSTRNLKVTGISTFIDQANFADLDAVDITSNSLTSNDVNPTFTLSSSGNAEFVGSVTAGSYTNINVTGLSTFAGLAIFNDIVDASTVDAETLRAPVGVVTALTSTDIVGAAGTFTTAFTLGSGATKYSFPVVDGSADQILVSNGSGTLSFQDVSSSMTISAGYASTDNVSLLSDVFTVAATSNETKTTLSDNTITVGLATDVIVGGGLTVTNNLLVLGNLTVEGTETVINVERLDVQDKTIGVASTSPSSNTTANGGGFFVHGGSDGDKTIFWSLAQDGFEVNQNWLPSADDTYSLGNSSRQWKDLFVNGLAELDDVNVSAAATINTLNVTGTGTITTADINGGNIDGTAIGAASSSTAIFTTLNAGTIVTGGRLDAGETTFSTLRVTGVSTVASLFLSTGTNTNGVGYFDANGQLQSTATPSAGIQTSNYILTTNASGVPSWTDTIDCGTF